MKTMKGKHLVIVLSLLLFTRLQSIAQSARITGKIINDKNEPLTGVSVSIEGRQSGTSSDVEGRFSLVVPAAKTVTIVFSAIGYQPKTMSDVTPGKPEELT